MADICFNTDCEIKFSEEEIDVLKKASEILTETAKELWDSGWDTDEGEQATFFLQELSGGIVNVINGKMVFP